MLHALFQTPEDQKYTVYNTLLQNGNRTQSLKPVLTPVSFKLNSFLIIAAQNEESVKKNTLIIFGCTTTVHQLEYVSGALILGSQL